MQMRGNEVDNNESAWLPPRVWHGNLLATASHSRLVTDEFTRTLFAENKYFTAQKISVGAPFIQMAAPLCSFQIYSLLASNDVQWWVTQHWEHFQPVRCTFNQ